MTKLGVTVANYMHATKAIGPSGQWGARTMVSVNVHRRQSSTDVIRFAHGGNTLKLRDSTAMRDIWLQEIHRAVFQESLDIPPAV
jgi:hypothetical protein